MPAHARRRTYTIKTLPENPKAPSPSAWEDTLCESFANGARRSRERSYAERQLSDPAAWTPEHRQFAAVLERIATKLRTLDPPEVVERPHRLSGEKRIENIDAIEKFLTVVSGADDPANPRRPCRPRSRSCSAPARVNSGACGAMRSARGSPS